MEVRPSLKLKMNAYWDLLVNQTSLPQFYSTLRLRPIASSTASAGGGCEHRCCLR